jgi:hypothetical protein
MLHLCKEAPARRGAKEPYFEATGVRKPRFQYEMVEKAKAGQ